IIGILIWACLALLAASIFMWYFVPPDDCFAYLQDPSAHLFLTGFVLAIAGFLVYVVVLLKGDFCVYICPYSRVPSVVCDNN
ncbi:cytochrome c oxidase accessory protein CcoG, partial [Aliarcobacter butzleri]